MADLLNGAGYDGITAQQDADLYAGIVGGLPVVLPVGEQMRAQAVTNNKIRIYDGELVSQGRRIHINAGKSDDFTIENGSQGVVRYDIIGYHIYKDASGNELAETFVRKNVGAAGVITEDIIRDGATESYISVYRVKLNGLAVEDVSPLYDMLPALSEVKEKMDGLPLMIQTGYLRADSTNCKNGVMTPFPIKFEKAFSKSPTVLVQACNNSSYVVYGNCFVKPAKITTTGFEIQVTNAGADSIAPNFNWIAIEM